MVSSCVVVGCTNRWGGVSCRVSFHRIPMQPERRKLWLASLNRKDWTPNRQDRVCGAHFLSGSVSHNKDDPDYVPTVNMGYDQSKSCTPLVKKPAKYHTGITCRALKRRIQNEEIKKQSAASVLLNFSNITPVENSTNQDHAIDRKATKDDLAIPNHGICIKHIKKEDTHNAGMLQRPLLPKAAPAMFSLAQTPASNLTGSMQVNNTDLVNNNGTPPIHMLPNTIPTMFTMTQTPSTNPPIKVQVNSNRMPSIPLLPNTSPSMFAMTQSPTSNPPIKVQLNSDGTSSKPLLPKPVPSTYFLTQTPTCHLQRNMPVNNNVLVNNSGTPSIPLLPNAVPSMFSMTQSPTNNPPLKVQVKNDGTSPKHLLPKPAPATYFLTQTPTNNPLGNVQVNNVPVTTSKSVPSVFVIPIQTSAITKKGATKMFGKDSDTDNAPEDDKRLHAETQTDIPNVCSHQFSLQTIIQSKPSMKLLQFYTGFSSLQAFYCVLQSLVPDKDRSAIVYWDRHKGNDLASDDDCINSDKESDNSDSDSDEEDTIQPYGSDKLSLEDEFLLTMMKLKLGLLNKDLAVRFCIPMSTVTNIFNTWVNLLYVVLGSIKIFPHRDIVIKHMTPEFQKQFPDVMLTLHCEELNIEMSTSEINANARSDNSSKTTCAFKGLVGVDSRGGVMFVSHLYPGDISNNDIFHRSGLFNLLKFKLESGELNQNDVIMADESFAIGEELSELGLCLKVPLVLGKIKRPPDDDDVKDMYDISQPNIDIERAIRKVRDFHIFRSKLPKQSSGVVNQIWTACCLLVNFQDPVITLPVESD